MQEWMLLRKIHLYVPVLYFSINRRIWNLIDFCPKVVFWSFFRNIIFLTSNFWSQSIFNIYAQTHETYLIRLDSFFPFLMTNHVWMIWINHIDAQFVKFFIISRLKGGTRGYGLDHRGLLGSHQWFWSSRTFGVKFGLVLFTFCSLPSLTRAAVPYP